MNRYTVLVTPDQVGDEPCWVAYVVEMPGIWAMGSTRIQAVSELETNLSSPAIQPHLAPVFDEARAERLQQLVLSVVFES